MSTGKKVTDDSEELGASETNFLQFHTAQCPIR